MNLIQGANDAHMPNIKSNTDIHWDTRAKSEASDEKTNIGDTVQRELETQFIQSVLPAGARVLEVGCGNGFLTQTLRRTSGFVDAFDYSENMIERAKQYTGETNNRFFVDNVLQPSHVQPPYDVVVCVRVLINLQDLAQQQQAVHNLAELLRTGGKLILVEGYADAFAELSRLRSAVGLPPVTPATINYYSKLEELVPTLTELFTFGAEFHTGTFDFLTRVVYPLLVGPDNVQEAGEFHRRTLPLAQAFSPTHLSVFARLRGFELFKR